MTPATDFDQYDIRPGGWGTVGLFVAVVATAVLCVASTAANVVR